MFYLLILPRRLKKEEWRVILGFRILNLCARFGGKVARFAVWRDPPAAVSDERTAAQATMAGHVPRLDQRNGGQKRRCLEKRRCWL